MLSCGFFCGIQRFPFDGNATTGFQRVVGLIQHGLAIIYTMPNPDEGIRKPIVSSCRLNLKISVNFACYEMYLQAARVYM